jgi:hypothetical protein
MYLFRSVFDKGEAADTAKSSVYITKKMMSCITLLSHPPPLHNLFAFPSCLDAAAISSNEEKGPYNEWHPCPLSHALTAGPAKWVIVATVKANDAMIPRVMRRRRCASASIGHAY